MKRCNPIAREATSEFEASLRELVRLLARQAAAEHVGTGLRDVTPRR
jgi:hypothetical protein